MDLTLSDRGIEIHRGVHYGHTCDRNGSSLRTSAPPRSAENAPENRSLPNERVLASYNERRTAEQHIKESKHAIEWTRLSCMRFAAISVQLQLHALAYNLANFLRPSHTRGHREMVDDVPSRAADQDRRPARAPRPLRRLPIGFRFLLGQFLRLANSLRRTPRAKIVWNIAFAFRNLRGDEPNGAYRVKIITAQI